MNSTYQSIQSSGGRLTTIKKAIVDVLEEKHCLLSKQELVERLKANKIECDRSTIYRQLQFLTEKNIVIKNTIIGIDYYEIPEDHHHHLICLKCGGIGQIKMENYLEKQEKQIAEQHQFKVVEHSLEFYGYCQRCQA